MRREITVFRRAMIGVLFALTFTILGGNPLTVNAASYKTVYKKLLTQGTYGSDVRTNYFTIVNIDKKGAPELITSPSSTGDAIDVFTVKKGRVKYLGQYLNKYMSGCIRYNPSKKGLVVAAGGNGSAGDALLKISGGKLKEKISTLQIFNRSTTYAVNYKKCSYKKYKKYTKKYFADSKVKTAWFAANTMYNRNRKLK